MLKVLNGSAAQPPYHLIPPHLFKIYKHPRCAEILEGLIERGLTGKEFLHWIVLNHNGDIRTAANEILSRRYRTGTNRGTPPSITP